LQIIGLGRKGLLRVLTTNKVVPNIAVVTIKHGGWKSPVIKCDKAMLKHCMLLKPRVKLTRHLVHIVFVFAS
jgi:hypothetical protein